MTKKSLQIRFSLLGAAFMLLSITSVQAQFSGYDLSLISVVSPVNNPDSLCQNPNPLTPVIVTLANLGGMDYNFAQDNITLSYKVTDEKQSTISGSITINNGGLLSGETNNIVLISGLPMGSGIYTITAWVSAPRDNFPCDDTITSTYLSGKVGLPLDDSITSPVLSSDFISVGMNTSAKWRVTQGSDGAVTPLFGTGMLLFNGSDGAVSQLCTRELDLYATNKPVLSLWYFHDTVSSNAYTDVQIVLNGNRNNGYSLLRLHKQNYIYGWRQYDVDLSPYIWDACVLICFQTRTDGNSTQYIDRIRITALQDLAVDTVLTSPLSACDLNNKEVKVVIHNPSGQGIDFASTPATINLRVNTTDYPYKLDGSYGLLGPLGRDTITITKMNFVQDSTYTLRAWITPPIDQNRTNDSTPLTTLFINPDIQIRAIYSGNPPSYLLPAGTKVNQTVSVTNKGNFDVYDDIPLVVEILGSSWHFQILRDTLRGVLQAGASQVFTFPKPYAVPFDTCFIIIAKAELACDANPQNNADTIIECVDMDDIELVSLITPSGMYDNIGKQISPVVRIKNWSPDTDFRDVPIYAVIFANGVSDTLRDTIHIIYANSTMSYTFTNSYTVPQVVSYAICVFVSSVDNNPLNDTIYVTRSINCCGIPNPNANDFVLMQNIPNPAQDNTLITYHIPEDGQVIFTVYSITGQTLHTEKQDARSGKNEIKFNTANFSNGIYYYSMEYKGERLVKKMTIRK